MVVLALASAAHAQVQPPAASPSGPDCGSTLVGLAGCLPYLTPGSTVSKPPKECCGPVKSSLASPASAACLCDAFGKNYGVPIDLARAAGLAAACGGNQAALSKCKIAIPGAPGSAPTEAPSPSSGSTPATGSPGPAKAAATRSPVSLVTLVLSVVAAPLLSHYL